MSYEKPAHLLDDEQDDAQDIEEQLPDDDDPDDAGEYDTIEERNDDHDEES